MVSEFAHSHRIRISTAAAKDILEIYDYVVEFDSEANADRLIAKIKSSIDTLSNFPERGSMPRDLLDIGIRDYRQIFFKPYRIIYRVSDKLVTVYGVLDGRRNLQTLLSRRLFRPLNCQAGSCIQAACLGARLVLLHSFSMSHFTSSKVLYISGVPVLVANSKR